jgi:hypothetical protein
MLFDMLGILLSHPNAESKLCAISEHSNELERKFRPVLALRRSAADFAAVQGYCGDGPNVMKSCVSDASQDFQFAIYFTSSTGQILHTAQPRCIGLRHSTRQIPSCVLGFIGKDGRDAKWIRKQ